MQKSRQRAFTIVELIVVISVIAILVVIGIVSYGSWQHSINVAQVKNDLHATAAAMESAKNFGDGYPLSIPDTVDLGEKTHIEIWGTPSKETYCLNGTYEGDETIAFYIDPTLATTAAKEGTCDDRETLTPPSKPTGLTIATASVSSIQADWDSQASVTSFTVQCAVDSAFITNVKSSTVAYTSTTTTISGLLEGTQYYCRLKATNAKGSSDWSGTKTTNTGITTPTGLAVNNKSATQITYSWNTVPGATSYQLRYDAGYSASGDTITVNGTSGTLGGLSPSRYYYFRVRAVTPNGQSTESSSVNTYTSIDWSVYTTFVAVGDWNNDGKNDIIGYRSDGSIYLHLGKLGASTPYGNVAGFESGRYLTNIGGDVMSLIGIGALPSGTAPSLWWRLNDGSGRFLTSNGSTGVTGSPATSGAAGTWSSCGSVFASRLYVTGSVTITCKTSSLYTWTLSSTGVPTLYNNYGSGWEPSFPGERAFGVGDWGNDGKGDIIGWTPAGAMTLYAGTGSGTTGSTYSLSSGWLDNLIFGGWDYTGDGKADLFRYIIGNNRMCMYPGNGVSYFVTGYTGCNDVNAD